MRALLGFAAFLVVVAILASLALAALAPAIASGLIRSSGLQARMLTVSVDAPLPLELLIGRADRLEVDATEVSDGPLTANALHAMIVPFDLLHPDSARASGRLEGTAVSGLPLGTVAFAGPARAPLFTARLAAMDVRRLVAGVAGVDIADVELLPPDVIRVTTAGHALDGRIGVTRDGLGLTASGPDLLGPLPIVSLLPDSPLRFHSVTLSADGATIEGELRLGLS